MNSTKNNSKKSGNDKVWLYAISSIFLCFGFVTLSAAIWYKSVYGDVGFDSIIFSLISNASGINNDIVYDYLLRSLLPAILVSVLFCFVFFYTPKKAYFIKFKKYELKFFPFSRLLSCILCYVLSFSLIISGVFVSRLSRKISSAVQKSLFFEENYVDPNEVEIVFPEDKRNLIYIFLESMEATYFSENKGGFVNHDIMSELWDLGDKNINFSHNSSVGGFKDLTCCSWTSAALVAQTTGIPLKMPTTIKKFDFENGNFLPGAANITSILKKNGYYQTFMVGSDSDFGNRRQFFQLHGADKIYDIDTAKADGIVPNDYYVWWGMEDKYLFEYAKQELTEIAKGDSPFAFTMLTVDTHFPDGYTCDMCENNFDEQYENVIACSNRQINDFINWVKDQPFYENTTIVIAGDHLSMDFEYITEIGAKDSDRYVYNCFINSTINTRFTKDREFTAVDMFPTTLAAIGCVIEGNRLGIGTNLFSGEPTVIEKFGYKYVDNEVAKESDYYTEKFYKNTKK